MDALRYTLVSDGPTDANLIPIINWTLKETGRIELAEGTRAEFWRLPTPPQGLSERIEQALKLYPCDALFVHRDAEKESPSKRNAEIQSAVSAVDASGRLPAVTVIPVRMLEAWLLFDEAAIRRAAGNPNGTVSLGLPPSRNIEDRPDPKEDLRHALRIASELRARRLKKFNTAQAFWRVVDFMHDFSSLRQLPAFVAFERAVARMRANQWRPGFYGVEPAE
jgi:hypothetical protein